MSWKQVAQFDNYMLLQWAVGDADGWIIRGAEELFAVDPQTYAEQWRIPLEAVPFMYREVVLTEYLAITPQTHPDKSTVLLAFDRATSRQVWQRSVGWQGRDNYGGIVLHNGYLGFMEQDGEHVRFVMADAQTGKTVQTTAGFSVPDAGPSPGSPRFFVAAQGYAYIIYSKTGLYRCKQADFGDLAFECVLEGHPLCIAADQEHVYCTFQKEIVRIDALSGNVSGRVALPENTTVESMISIPDVGPCQTSGQVALLFAPNQGMLCVDFAGDGWRIDESFGWYVTHAAATPHGLAVVLNEMEKPVYILDYATGAIQEELQPEREQWWESMVYWMGEVLLVDSSRGARVLVWQDDGIMGFEAGTLAAYHAGE